MYNYSRYGLGFNTRGANMSSSVHVYNKIEGPTQGLHDTTLKA